VELSYNLFKFTHFFQDFPSFSSFHFLSPLHESPVQEKAHEEGPSPVHTKLLD